MNIDEKLKNNWYLEQDEINTLIKRYRMMKYFNYVLLLIISVLLLSSCNIFNSDIKQEIYKITGVISSDVDTFMSDKFPQNKSFVYLKVIQSKNINNNYIILMDFGYSYQDTLTLNVIKEGAYYKEISK